MFGLGMPELLCIFGIALVLFGAKRLPELGRGLGRAISSFKEGMSVSGGAVDKDEPQ